MNLSSNYKWATANACQKGGELSQCDRSTTEDFTTASTKFSFQTKYFTLDFANLSLSIDLGSAAKVKVFSLLALTLNKLGF